MGARDLVSAEGRSWPRVETNMGAEPVGYETFVPPGGVGAPLPTNDVELIVDQDPLGPVIISGHRSERWLWQVLPQGLIYRSYAAGVHEPRISGVVFGEADGRALLDVTLGGRAGVLRYGNCCAAGAEGFQIDVEGAAFPRLNLDSNWDLDYTDFRFGVPFTYGQDNWQVKFAYYHLSSHLGDELAIREPGSLARRINYSRDELVWGLSYFIHPAVRLYGEAGWAFHTDGGARPWEFQFGIDYAQPGPTGLWGTPFFAINGHLRQEVRYGGNLVVQTGILWRGMATSEFRMGFHYFNGKSSQYEVFNDSEQQVGFGIWYDF